MKEHHMHHKHHLTHDDSLGILHGKDTTSWCLFITLWIYNHAYSIAPKICTTGYAKNVSMTLERGLGGKRSLEKNCHNGVLCLPTKPPIGNQKSMIR